jgi:hypothetical protein
MVDQAMNPLVMSESEQGESCVSRQAYPSDIDEVGWLLIAPLIRLKKVVGMLVRST